MLVLKGTSKPSTVTSRARWRAQSLSPEGPMMTGWFWNGGGAGGRYTNLVRHPAATRTRRTAYFNNVLVIVHSRCNDMRERRGPATGDARAGTDLNGSHPLHALGQPSSTPANAKPQRGGMCGARQFHAAPMGLKTVLFGLACYKHVAPTELAAGRPTHSSPTAAPPVRAYPPPTGWAAVR